MGRFAASTKDFEDLLASGADAGDSVTAFDTWEVVHWRLRSKHMRSEYGYSVLDPARWAWRRLVMLEDSMLVYKLTRAPARFAFYVDCGDLPPSQALAYVNQVKRGFKKKRLMNSTTGNLDFRMNPLSPDEDFWIPTRGGTESTRIDTIAGPDYQAIDDVEYFRSKLFSAIKVPKSYLGLEGESNRASLSQEDVRFARTLMRVQREVKNGLKKVCRVHLAALNIDPDLVSWDLKMTVPSSIFEMAQLEVGNARADLARNMEEYMPKDWILQHIFGFSRDDASTLATKKSEQSRSVALDDAATQAEAERKFGAVAGPEPAAAREDTSDLERRMTKLLESNRKLLEDASETARKTSKSLDDIKPMMKDMHRSSKQRVG
jgi:hypothetical protein